MLMGEVPVAQACDIVFVPTEILLLGRLQLERAELLVDDLPHDLI